MRHFIRLSPILALLALTACEQLTGPKPEAKCATPAVDRTDTLYLSADSTLWASVHTEVPGSDGKSCPFRFAR